MANQAGVPTKLAEYLSVGRAIASSCVGDIPVYLTHNQDALLCAPGDAGALAETLKRLIEDRTLREHLAANARYTASRFFDYRSAASNLEAAMLDAIPVTA
jgi:glycosyltransferase involved in cell wall biosynthesis